MATFRLHDNNTIYLYHWIDSRTAFKASTKLRISSDEWDKQNQKPISNRTKWNGTVISTALTQIEADFNTCINNMIAKKVVLSVANIKAHFNNEGNSDCFIQFYKGFLQANKSNYKTYNAPLEHIVKFAGSKLQFNQADFTFFQRYQSYLESEGLNGNTVSFYLKIISNVFRQAVKVGVIDKAPALPSIKIVSKDTIALNEDELRLIYNYKPRTIQAQIVRDYFILGAYTGLRYSDWDKATLPATGNMMIITATKTLSTSLVPVHPIVREILTKYNNQMPTKCDVCNMNRTLKRIAKAAGITGTVNIITVKGGKKVLETKERAALVGTHTARRSLATNLIVDGVPAHIVMKVTGHQTHKSFSKYVKLDELTSTTELSKLSFFK